MGSDMNSMTALKATISELKSEQCDLIERLNGSIDRVNELNENNITLLKKQINNGQRITQLFEQNKTLTIEHAMLERIHDKLFERFVIIHSELTALKAQSNELPITIDSAPARWLAMFKQINNDALNDDDEDMVVSFDETEYYVEQITTLCEDETTPDKIGAKAEAIAAYMKAFESNK